MARHVTMIGSFPPPVGGAAKNNAILYETLCELGVPTRRLDVSASKLSHRRTVGFHAERLWRNLCVNFALISGGQDDDVLYMVPDAGLGAWYSLAHIRVAAARFRRIVLHHRTFRYIDSPSKPMAGLVKAAGDKATHVFLSPGMAHAFEARYGRTRSMIASNAHYVLDEAKRPPTEREAGPLRIGHLSNLCKEKGFFEVADAFEAVATETANHELHLAGPIVEPEVQTRLTSLQARFGSRIKYLGQLSGTAKQDFYRGLDLFLFPTQFAQEAAPNVVYEALAAGVPTLATDRGCIPEMISDPGGAVCSRRDDFTTFVRDYLAGFDVNAASARRAAIKSSLLAECIASKEQYAKLLSMLSDRSALA